MWNRFAQKGVFLALAAVGLPVFIGSVGLAFDVGMVCLHKAQLQNAADAAVIAGGHAYSEQLETSDTADAVDRFLLKDKEMTDPERNQLDIKSVGTDGSRKIVLGVTDEVPLYFVKIFGLESVTIQAKSAALCKKIGGSSIFDYTMIAGSTAIGNSKEKNAMLLDTDNLRLNGKIHTNGGIYLDSNHQASLGDGGTLTSNADAIMKSSSKSNASGLWGMYQDQGANWGSRQTDTYLYDNDEKISESTYRHYYRMSDSTGKADAMPSATNELVDISLSETNDLTSGLYKYIQKISQMSLAERQAEQIYYESDGEYSESKASAKTYDLYRAHNEATGKYYTTYPNLTANAFKTTDNKAYSHPFKVIIVDDNLNASIENSAGDNDYTILISLHGNIQLNIDTQSFNGLLYAPNGLVWLNNNTGTEKVSGSFVGKHVSITSGHNISASHSKFGFTGDSGGSSTTGGKYNISLVNVEDDD